MRQDPQCGTEVRRVAAPGRRAHDRGSGARRSGRGVPQGQARRIPAEPQPALLDGRRAGRLPLGRFARGAQAGTARRARSGGIGQSDPHALGKGRGRERARVAQRCRRSARRSATPRPADFSTTPMRERRVRQAAKPTAAASAASTDAASLSGSAHDRVVARVLAPFGVARIAGSTSAGVVDERPHLAMLRIHEALLDHLLHETLAAARRSRSC